MVRKLSQFIIIHIHRSFIVIVFIIFNGHNITAQKHLSFFEPADSFNSKRFWTATYFSAAVYAGTIIGLNEIWYKQYPRESFHFFNDSKEWLTMDKAGHSASSYAECRYLYEGAKWTGMKENSAIWTGIGIASAFHLSIEVLDGFSSKWGFSVSDVGANILGVSLFAAQQWGWKEQRILAKWSNMPQHYPNTIIVSDDGNSTTTLSKRAKDLFGTSYAETFFKDYNATAAWLSFNLKSFFPSSNIPGWLNIAVGYGTQNLYGGYQNTWTEGNASYTLNKDLYPRYHQYYLSFDIDTSKIPVKSHFLRTILDMINFIKIPAPGIEFNSLGGVKLHALAY